MMSRPIAFLHIVRNETSLSWSALSLPATTMMRSAFLSCDQSRRASAACMTRPTSSLPPFVLRPKSISDTLSRSDVKPVSRRTQPAVFA